MTDNAEPTIAALQAELARARADAEELRGMVDERQAEFRAYKRRHEANLAGDRAQQNASLIQRLLPLNDDLQRALSQRPAGNAWGEGVALIARKFSGVLEKEGVRRIEALGQPFNAHEHEAIGEQVTDATPEGHVAAVVREGYYLGDRLLRPAQVLIAKAPPVRAKPVPPVVEPARRSAGPERPSYGPGPWRGYRGYRQYN